MKNNIRNTIRWIIITIELIIILFLFIFLLTAFFVIPSDPGTGIFGVVLASSSVALLIYDITRRYKKILNFDKDKAAIEAQKQLEQNQLWLEKSELEKIKSDLQKQREYMREYNRKFFEEYGNKLEEANKEACRIVAAAEKNAAMLQSNIDSLREEKKELEAAVASLSADYEYQIVNFPIDDEITSEEYKNQLALLYFAEKKLIEDGKAVTILDSSTNSRILNNNIKQLMRSFNNETAVIISEVTVKNIDSKRSKLIRSFETLNNIFKTDGVALSMDLFELKLKMLNIKYAQEYQKEQERIQQRAIREQMVEEEKVRREIENEKAKIEKEETQFKNEISKLTEYMRKASDDIEKKFYIDKIKGLEDKLKAVEKDKGNVLEREQNTRAGFVYIISNIGSFGEDIYKIGMTRRLEPMDRINELSSASVPFGFDVHAMIFSDDAPALEATLHNIFADNRVNKVNPRKEFYKVSLGEIEKAVKENFNATVTFTKVAEAYQYRESLRIANEQ